MIIDCHYHFDPRIQPLENLISKMDRYGIHQTTLIPNMCDPFAHPRKSELLFLRFCLFHRAFRGIAKGLTTRFTPEGRLRLPAATLDIYPDPDNARVAEIIQAHPDRFLGWIFVNPEGEADPVAEFERWSGQEGYIGVKAHPFWHRYPPGALLPVAEKAAAKGMPLLIHPGFGEDGDFMPLVNQLPELKLVLAHAAFPCFKDTWARIRHLPNVYVDLSADAYVDDKITRMVVDALGPGRCLFGSDGPFGAKDVDGYFHNGFIKQRLEELFPDHRIQARLLGGNFRELVF